MKTLLAACALTGLGLVAASLLSSASPAGAVRNQVQAGALVLVGGGGTPPEALIEALALTGKEAPKVLVVPQASDLPDRGKSSVEMWREQGVEAKLLEPLDRQDAEEMLEEADLIWLSGGSQRNLMRRLAEHQFASKIAFLHGHGTVIGGTSAGAAAMSTVMLSGDPDPRALIAGAAAPYRGLAVWPSAIVDQHFIERDRYGRLLTAVLSKPRMVGVGIAERTAVIVQGDDLRVLGEGQVVIFDARKAKTERVPKGELQSARGVQVHVIAAGETWAWFQ